MASEGTGKPLPAAPVIDVHHHFATPELFAGLKARAEPGRRRLVTDTISITLQERLFDLPGQLADMEAAGVDAAVFQNCALNVFGARACDALNEAAAEGARRWPNRFIPCAHVAPQEPTGLGQMTQAIEVLGLRAVALPTSTLGMGLDDPAMDPYYERIQAWGVPLVLHPALRPPGADTRYQRERSLGREFDIAQAVVALIHAVLPRFPRLRVVVPHCGGAFPFLLGRVRMFYVSPGEPEDAGAFARLRAAQDASGYGPRFDALCSQLYFDGCGHGAWSPALRFTLEVAGPERLLFGTDYPLECSSAPDLDVYRRLLDGLHLTGEQRQAVLGGTAASLFGLR